MFRKFLLLLFAIGLAGPVQSQDRLATEFDELSPRRLDNAVTRDLTRMIEVRDQASRSGGWGTQTVSFRTDAVGSDMLGVCQRDLLFMDYDTVESRSFPRGATTRLQADSRVRPFSIKTARQFYFPQPPTQESMRERPRNESRWSEDCSQANSLDNVGWVESDQAYVAAFGFVNILPNASAAIEQGLVRRQNVNGSSACEGEDCERPLSAAVNDFRSMGRIERCADDGEIRCYLFVTRSDAITVRYRYQNNGYSPADIVSVRVQGGLNIIII